jgi:hypothetical protein
VLYFKLLLYFFDRVVLLLLFGLDGWGLFIMCNRSFWMALAFASKAEPGLQGVDYDRLAESAENQHRRVEVLRLDAAREALIATD